MQQRSAVGCQMIEGGEAGGVEVSGLKWEALQAWRRKFIDINRREPKLWLDKCCIDQTNIAANLMW